MNTRGVIASVCVAVCLSGLTGDESTKEARELACEFIDRDLE